MKKILILFLCIFYSPNLLSTTIRVVNLQQLVDQNKDLVQLVSLIETDQLEHRKIFFNKELKLNSRLEEIEELKLILEENQLKIEIEQYNNNLSKFNDEIKNFNIHYENQVNVLKNNIINKILEIMQIYASENKIDLILDSNNYILSNNSINITDIILIELNKINFDISFEKYK